MTDATTPAAEEQLPPYSGENVTCTTKFNEAEARRGLIRLVQTIAYERFPDPVIKQGAVAMVSGLVALYGDAVQKAATETAAGQAEARIAELERKIVDAELHAARFQAAWHSARLRARHEASHSRLCRISRNGWKRRAKQAEAAIARVRTELDAARRMLDPTDLRLVDEMLTTVDEYRTRAGKAERAVDHLADRYRGAEATTARVRDLHRDAYAGTSDAGASCTAGCGAWPCPTLNALNEQPTT